jgi:hypothetical protein
MKWFVIVALLMVVAALVAGYGAHDWAAATVWAIGAVVVAVVSLHDRS